MDQSSQPLSKAVEQHQQALQQEQQSISEVVQYPFKQAAELQQNTAQILLSGMELTDATQRMGLDLTRSMLQGYLQAVKGSMPTSDRGSTAQKQQSPSQQPRTEYAGSPSQAPAGETQQTQPTSQFQQSTTRAPNQYQQPPAQTAQPNQFQQRPAWTTQSNQYQQPSAQTAQPNQYQPPAQTTQWNQSPAPLPQQETATNRYEQGQETGTSQYEQAEEPVETPPQQY